MAKILSIAFTENLKTTRQLILQNAGHEVLSFSQLPDLEQLQMICDPNLAVIGHGFRGPDKRRIALTLNEVFPGIPLLELCMHSPEIPGADFIFSHSPESLVTAIDELLAGHRVRGFLVEPERRV
ncbi:MAG TPA: hypothetical protein VFY05_09820 [Candidatus Angelobacter sp.]|nr:hypothetical protein [Candidatus Angelobacter sp.]